LPGVERSQRSKLPGFLTATTWVEFRDTLDVPHAFRRWIDDLDNVHSEDSEQTKDDAFAVVQYVVVVDSKDLQSRGGFQVVLARLVWNAAIVVTSSVELHDKFVGRTVEIHDVRTYDVLASEFHFREAAITEQLPQHPLGERGVLSEFACLGSHVG
jgi:hypothetical protein